MTLGRLLAIIVLLGAVVAGGMWYRNNVQGTPEGGGQGGSAARVEQDYYTKGELYFTAFKYDQALAMYQLAVAEKPADSRVATAKFRIAKCLEEIGKQREALQAYQDYLAAYPQGASVRQAQERVEYLTPQVGK